MKTRQEEVFNISALYLHIYDKVYFFLDDLSRYLSVYKGGGSKREWSAHYPPVSFCFSYNVSFCLLTFNVFLTYRLSCVTMTTEFYF